MKINQLWHILTSKRPRTAADVAIDSFAKTLAEDIRNNPRALRSLRNNPTGASERAIKALACDTVRLLKTPTNASTNE